MTGTRTRVMLVSLALCGLTSAVACSGGGGGAEQVLGVGGGSLAAGFAPDQPSPGANTTAMSLGGASGDVVTVSINVTDTFGIYGASFDVTFDPARAEFVGLAHGSLLESGGHTPTYQVNMGQPGTLLVVATRNGNVPSVNAVGTKNLVNLTFRVKAAGDAPLAFVSGSRDLFDGQIPPQSISGVQWYAGSLQAN